jgi:alpha-L-fucosidase
VGQVTITAAAPLLDAAEIESNTMLGVAGQLDWALTPQALTITAPREKPCDHAYVFKIQRRRPF